MNDDKHDEVLERNVSTLLGSGGEPPRIADTTRARIKAELVDKFGVTPARSRLRSPLIAIGLGLAATAAAALIVTRFVGAPADAPRDGGELADGSTWIAEPGAEVEVLGHRRVRVAGAALLDVTPGKGTFVVETTRGRIEVLGTRFLVDADADRTTAAVVRGSVKLASPEGFVTLHAGEQGIAEPGKPPTRGPAPRLSSLVSWAKAARARDEEQGVKPLRNGTLFAREPNNPHVPESPLPITKLAVDVVVEDQVARVALDQTFHNPQPMMLEGMYRFAIPPDASLQRLAMYVDGELMESAVVERMRARRIYEDIVYRRLDPALLEWAGTGRLALRVYPLPAREDKRLLLAYTQSLPKLYDDWTLAVPLPEVDLPVGELAFAARLRGCANCEVTSPSHAVTVERAGDDAVVKLVAKNVELGDSLVLRVRDPRTQATVARDGDFVLVRARPVLAATPRPYRPRTWVILDDVSASRGPMELRAQADLVDAFMRELDEDDRVAVVAFDTAARVALSPTRVDDVDRQALRRALDDEGGVGATDLAAALAEATQLLAGVPADDAMIVYVGDGVVTTGPTGLAALRAQLAGKARFIGVGIGDGPDTQTLDALAAATGGYTTTIDLADDVYWRAFDLVAALHTPRVTGLEAKLVDTSGTAVPATIYTKRAQVADGEELELVAKLAGAGTPAFAVVTGTLDGKPWEQRIALANARSGAGYLPRLWAQQHIAARLLAKHEPVIVPPCPEPVRGAKAPACASEAELRAQRDEAIRKEVVALGMQYFLLSRHTSLIVLENDKMYAQYGVKKGAGDTWAPYEVPAKIPVAKRTHVAAPADVASDAELVRTPLRVFYDYAGRDRMVLGELAAADGRWRALEQAQTSGILATREQLRLDGPLSNTTRAPFPTTPAPAAGPIAGGERRAEGAEDGDLDLQTEEGELQKRTRRWVSTDEVSGTLGWGGGGTSAGFAGLGRGRLGIRGGEVIGPHGLYPQRFRYASDTAFDDLTAFVPALFADDADELRAAWKAGAPKPFAISDGARDLLVRARRALPVGTLRWGDRELALDGVHRFGWRRTTGADLAETASFDGKSWTRRYAELGLDVTREIGDDDVALAFAHLPLWIAEPAHYARWFEVTLKNPREITLARPTTTGKSRVVYELVFDDNHRLVAIRDAQGSELVQITWGANGPTAARVHGESIAVGFTARPIASAVEWAHEGSRPGIAIEAAGKLPAYWTARLATLGTGTPAWRHAQRQLMVSLAATNDRSSLFAAYERLRAHGGVELGDLVLASGGVATAATDAAFAPALAPLATTPVARYLAAGRAYGKAPRPERLQPHTRDGMVGALWTLREAVAHAQASAGRTAIDRLLALGDRAYDFRLVGVAIVTQQALPPADIGRAWDAVATGELRNIARAQAARALANRGAYDAAAERIAALVADLDLAARPPQLADLQWQFANSRRGAAGWNLVWATWRDRVLAGNSFEHVVALLDAAIQRPADAPAILARAAMLAGRDPARVVEVAQLATAHGQPGLAQSLIEPVLKANPTPALLRIAGALAQQQGRSADALAYLEQAQAAGADERVGLATVRGELAQIIGVARQLAVQSIGPAREAAVQKALAWGRRWRAIDPGNPQIDVQLGELLLVVGDTAGAWRQLSTVIERDPMDGTGYQLVADAFERQGRVAEAVAYWQHAIVIDQTNPTHRLRKAQALIALGRTEEGDALLAEIAGRRWHERWAWTAQQAKELLARGKRQR